MLNIPLAREINYSIYNQLKSYSLSVFPHFPFKFFILLFSVYLM
ncbi:hypothetical protein D1BOALGB6SA_4936 [Olavius sp. associated proteobacterium Delta 1]|nr:hypothetical protein D1BOALGB6SA_4936 [Olavius sp. associated proteobacterium Delta 1]